MALFNRDYDRDYGYRGGSMQGGGYGGSAHRDMGDRAAEGIRRGWNRATNGARDAFGGGYDRDMGSRGGALGGGGGMHGGGMNNSGYDRDMGGRSWWADGAYSQDRDLFQHRYDRDVTYRGNPGGNVHGGVGMQGGYDRDMGGREMGGRETGGRDMEAGRWQTDNGDPFGDRAARTPIRMMRGGFRNDQDRGGMDYDRDFGRGYGAGSNMGYDRDVTGRGYTGGLGHDPYRGDMNTGRQGWGASNRDRGYDRGMF